LSILLDNRAFERVLGGGDIKYFERAKLTFEQLNESST
jgi:hypothetical protein